MAKRRIEINLEDVARLAALQCTLTEAAAFFRIKAKKLKEIMEDFPEVKEAWVDGQQAGMTSLRRKQFRLAATSASMAIHLGKNILNQRDVSTTEVTGKNGGPIETMDLSQLDADARDKLRELLLRASRPKSDS